MPTYSITGPDGKRYSIDGPQGATREQVVAKIQEAHTASQPKAPEQTSQALGFEQSVGNFMGNIADMAGKVPGVAPAFETLFGHSLSDSTAALRNPDHAPNVKPGGLGQFAGELPGYVGLGMTGLGPFASGAIGSAMNTHSDSLPAVGADALLGGTLGKVGDLAIRGVQKVIAPQLEPAVKTLMDAKIPLTPGQTVGGMVKNLEDKAVSWPIVGHMIKGAQDRSTEGFNTAILNDALSHVQEKLPGNLASGRKAVDFVATKIGEKYDAVLPRMAGQIDQQLQTELNDIGHNAIGEGATPGVLDRYKNVIKAQLLGRTQKGGVLNGDQLKRAQQDLGRIGRNMSSSASGEDQQLGHMILDANSRFNDMLLRHNPEFSSDLQAANSAWAKYARIRRAASALGNADGAFTAPQYANAVKALDKSVDKGNYARGKALNQELSDAAKQILPNSVPNSGTTDRLLASMLPLALTGSLPLAPKAALPALAAAALYTKPGQTAARFALGGTRPAWAQPVADSLTATRLPASILLSSMVPTLSAPNQ